MSMAFRHHVCCVRLRVHVSQCRVLLVYDVFREHVLHRDVHGRFDF